MVVQSQKFESYSRHIHQVSLSDSTNTGVVPRLDKELDEAQNVNNYTSTLSFGPTQHDNSVKIRINVSKIREMQLRFLQHQFQNYPEYIKLNFSE